MKFVILSVLQKSVEKILTITGTVRADVCAFVIASR